MNLSNKLTLSRFFMVPFFVLFMEADIWARGNLTVQAISQTIGLLIFIAAALTDYYDGVLARKHGWITNFGKFMDPLADKLIVAAAFVVLVEDGVFPAWMVIIVLCREFLITGLRMLGASQNRVIHADRWGKNKTVSQMVAIITALIYTVVRVVMLIFEQWSALEYGGRSLEEWLKWLLFIMMGVVVFFTVMSGYLYLSKNRDLLREDG